MRRFLPQFKWVKAVNASIPERSEIFLYEIFKESIEETKEDIEQKFNEIKDEAEEKIDEFKEEIQDKHEETIEKFEDVKEHVLERKEEVIEKVVDKIEDVKEDIHDTAKKNSIWVSIGYYFVCSCIKDRYSHQKLNEVEDPAEFRPTSVKHQ